MKIDVSDGEILDKLTILEIKMAKCTDPVKLKNIEKEFLYLRKVSERLLVDQRVIELYQKLKEINLALWDVEDRLRILEKEKDFGDLFIDFARQVYYTNDDRAAVKKEINTLLSSSFVEEKIYQNYKD